MKTAVVVVVFGLVFGVVAAWSQVAVTRTAGDGNIEVIAGDGNIEVIGG
jgi:hypothetical protein